MILLPLATLGLLTGLVPFTHLSDEVCTASKQAQASSTEKDLAQKSIVDTAIAAGEFKTLATALGAAGLVEALQGEGPFTVFAPSDAAFAKLPQGTLASLLEPKNKHQLVALLQYHVVPGRVMAEAVVELPGAASLNGQRLTVLVEEGVVRVGGAKVVKTDVSCSNGVIHVIDTVLVPSSSNLIELAQGAGTFKTLLAAAQAAGLADTLVNGGPFTILAPTDEAFAKLPAGTLEALLAPEAKDRLAAILKAHVLEGRVFSDQVVKLQEAQALSGVKLAIRSGDGGLSIAGARVVKADLQAKNGVVHVIDTVIVPD